MKAILGALLLTVVVGCGRADEPARVSDGDALAILESTPWLDRVPEAETDVLHTYVYARGEGVYVTGNAHKGSYETFRYFVEDDRLRLRFTDEGKSYDARFRIERVRHRIFEWKLTFDRSPRGPDVYYGFDHGRGRGALPAWVARLAGGVR